MTAQISWLSNLIVQDEDSIKFLAGTNLSFSGSETVIVDGPQLNVLHEFSSDSFGSARYFIHAECGSDQRETLEAAVVTKLDQAALTVFGRVNTGVDLINISADISNSILRLYASPAIAGLQNIKCTVFATLAENIVTTDSRATVYYFTKVQNQQFDINAGPYTTDEIKPQLTFYTGLTYRFDQSDPSNNNNPLLIGAGADSGLGNLTSTYAVTVAGPQAGDSGNKYVLDGVYRLEPNFVAGYTYVFNQDDATNVYFPNATGTTANPHPVNFSADNLSGELGGGTSYLDNVEYFLDGAVVTQAVYNSSAFNTAVSRQVRISVTDSTPATLYYWCYNHQAMGNSITSTYMQGLRYYINGNISQRAEYIDINTFNAANQRYIELTIKDNTPSMLYYYSSENNNFGNAITVASLVQSIGDDSSGSTVGGGGGVISAANVSLSNLESTAINLSLIPNITSSIDLGSNDKRWRDLYLSGDSLIIGAAIVTASGSAINLPAGSTVGGESISGGSGGIGGSANSFSTIAVPGQPSVVADSATDILTIAAGTGIAITTNAATDTLTISNTAASTLQNVFTTIGVSGQSDVVADQADDTLTLVAGPNITITTNATNDSITISAAATGEGGTGGVSSGQVNRLAYYAATGSIIQDTGANLTWTGSNLNIVGSVTASALVSYIRAYFNTLAELQLVSPDTWHGMVAHVHENGRMYFAHANAWVPLANQSDLTNNFSTISVAGQNNVVADQLNDILTLTAGTGIAITTNAGTDTITISATGGGGTASNSFETIAVPGQPSVVADSATDILTIAAGTGIAITTNAATDTLTISNTAISSNSFGTILVAGQSNVVADQANDLLTLVAGLNVSITTDASTDTVTINAVSGGASANSFATISVPGQNSVVADQLSDTLTMIAGTGITITTDANSDSLTFTALAGGSANSFSTISVAGQNNVVADSATDTLTIAAGTGITITTNAATDTLTFSAAASGSSTFNSLSDVTSAGLTVDKIAYPAITMLQTTNSGSSAYLFNNQYSGNNPTLYALSGTTIAFNLSVVGHPFLIQTSGGTNYSVGLIHVSTAGAVSTGASAQGQVSGTLYWQIPIGTTGNYRYICSIHGSMVGVITIKDFVSI